MQDKFTRREIFESLFEIKQKTILKEYEELYLKDPKIFLNHFKEKGDIKDIQSFIQDQANRKAMQYAIKNIDTFYKDMVLNKLINISTIDVKNVIKDLTTNTKILQIDEFIKNMELLKQDPNLSKAVLDINNFDVNEVLKDLSKEVIKLKLEVISSNDIELNELKELLEKKINNKEKDINNNILYMKN